MVLIAKTRENITTLNAHAGADMIFGRTLSLSREAELNDGSQPVVGEASIAPAQ